MSKKMFGLFSTRLISVVIAFALIFTSTSVLMFTVTAQETPFIVNGGFEDGLTGYEKTSNLIYEVVTNEKHSGEKSVKLWVEGGWAHSSPSNGYELRQSVNVKPNTDYRWKFWYKSDVGKSKVLAGVLSAENIWDLLPSGMTSDGGDIASANVSFDELRGAGTPGNWHQFGTEDWREYTVTFNSGEQTAVYLTLELFYDNRCGWTDDWSIEEIDPNAEVTVKNGGFEDDLNGYKTTSTLTSEIVTDEKHSGSKSVKLGASGSDMNTAYLYQEIDVKPDTQYKWKFWYKSNSGNNVLAGVRTQDGSKLLPSGIATSGGVIASDNVSFADLRDASVAANWHQGMTTPDWKEYTVTFNSGDQTTVLLTLNLFYNNRIGWTDDWSICKKVSMPGDINDDGVVNAIDLIALCQALLSSDTEYTSNLDVNGDKAVNILDLVYLKKISLISDAIEGYSLVWYDDFNGSDLSSDKWTLYPHMKAQDDLEIRSDKSAVSVENGTVKLSTGKADDDKYYANASLTTSGVMAFKYGYIEMRAKVPFGAPSFPSFWMKSAMVNNSSNMGEIDIFEHFGNKNSNGIESTVHVWSNGTNNSKLIGTYKFDNEEIAEGWHTYGILWTAEKIEFKVDNVTYATYDLTQKDGLANTKAFDDYYYLIMNNYLFTASGISRPGYNANANDVFPIDYEIDYVRLYQDTNVDSIMVY